jgi:hypothetical protein
MTSAATLARPATDPQRASAGREVAREWSREPTPAAATTTILAMRTAFQAPVWSDQ